MRRSALIAAAALLMCGCDRPEEAPPPSPGPKSEAPAPPRPAPIPPGGPAARWELQSSGEGVALALATAPQGATLRLFCASGERRLLVNVPAFRPIGSEERLSVGGGGDVVALVANTRGDGQRGGVSGTGEVPDNLASLVGGPLSVSYGAQTSGPHPAPPPNLSRAFVAACGADPATANDGGSPGAGATRPCLMQDAERLQVTPLRVVGTEPFWGARIEGRCVTYSDPEDQQGTRIWTRFTPVPGGGLWTGALGGRRFELRTREEPGCSDGMSDRRYPIAVELVVNGEQRRGCAAPI